MKPTAPTVNHLYTTGPSNAARQLVEVGRGHRYASATVHAWSVVAPRWQRARPLLDLEARLVGAAVVRGCTAVLLNALRPWMHYENGNFWIPAAREVTDQLGGQRLVFVPTIAGLSGRVGIGLPDVFYIAYPVPGQAGLGEHGATHGSGWRSAVPDAGANAGLCVAHGGRPGQLGQLAAAVGVSPRVTSYHCDHLEATGLILRERRGKSVWVSRTDRGHEPVDVLSA